MQARRSLDPHRVSGGWAGDREGLIHAYDEEENTGFGLTDLTEDSDDNDGEAGPLTPNPLRSHPNGLANGNGNGHGKMSFEPPRPR
jgi:hypothetical protein